MSSPNISRMGGRDCKICRRYRLTDPHALVSTRKSGLKALVTRKCEDCLTSTVIASRNIMVRVIHWKSSICLSFKSDSIVRDRLRMLRLMEHTIASRHSSTFSKIINSPHFLSDIWRKGATQCIILPLTIQCFYPATLHSQCVTHHREYMHTLTMVLLCRSIVLQPIHLNFNVNSTPITLNATNSKVPWIPTGSSNFSTEGFSTKASSNSTMEKKRSNP